MASLMPKGSSAHLGMFASGRQDAGHVIKCSNTVSLYPVTHFQKAGNALFKLREKYKKDRHFDSSRTLKFLVWCYL